MLFFPDRIVDLLTMLVYTTNNSCDLNLDRIAKKIWNLAMRNIKKGLSKCVKYPLTMQIFSYLLVFTAMWLIFTLSLNMQRPFLEAKHAELNPNHVLYIKKA
jgi:hypothetical protein